MTDELYWFKNAGLSHFNSLDGLNWKRKGLPAVLFVSPNVSLRMLVERAEVDEEWYLEVNPDVAAGIQRGEVSSATDHFRRWGFLEGRLPRPLAFDEKWYRNEYPDVDAAIRAGDFANGYTHFIQYGAAEGRQFRESNDVGKPPWDRNGGFAQMTDYEPPVACCADIAAGLHDEAVDGGAVSRGPDLGEASR